MRVAAIYDIHGNLPALGGVLDAIRPEEVDQVVVGGDIVPGPMPDECISALEELPVPVRFIRGNGETDILAARHGAELVRVPPRFHETMHWVAERLMPERLADFATWPRTLRLSVPGLGEVEFCHATPRDDNEIFTRATPEYRLRPIFEATGAAVVVCGHTHMQFDRRALRRRIRHRPRAGRTSRLTGSWCILTMTPPSQTPFACVARNTARG